MYAWGMRKSEEGLRSPTTGVTYRLCATVWVLGLNLDPLQEQKVPLPMELSPQFPHSFLSLLAVYNTFMSCCAYDMSYLDSKL